MRLWELCKRHGKGALVVLGGVLFLFGLAFLIAAAYYATAVTTVTEEAIVYSAIAEGVLLMFVSVVGALTIRHRTMWMIWLLIVLSFSLIIIELALIGTALVGLDKMNTVASAPTSFNITSDATMVQLSDFTLSLYAYCCTGCPVSLCGQTLPNTTYCDQSTTPPHCMYVPPCAFGTALDGRCFLHNATTGVVPPLNTQGDCAWLKSAGWGVSNNPLVGNIGGTLASDPSCGGGSPKIFQTSVLSWAQIQYTWLSACAGVVIFLQFCQVGATLAFRGFILDNSRDGPPKDQLRPWAHA